MNYFEGKEIYKWIIVLLFIQLNEGFRFAVYQRRRNMEAELTVLCEFNAVTFYVLKWRTEVLGGQL